MILLHSNSLTLQHLFLFLPFLIENQSNYHLAMILPGSMKKRLKVVIIDPFKTVLTISYLSSSSLDCQEHTLRSVIHFHRAREGTTGYLEAILY